MTKWGALALFIWCVVGFVASMAGLIFMLYEWWRDTRPPGGFQ